jgi:hypothetical protein
MTSCCSPVEAEIFFGRLLASMNMRSCSDTHIQGLMHWFTCVPGMNFEYITDMITYGNPCKYWALNGEECPSLSAECLGNYCNR